MELRLTLIIIPAVLLEWNLQLLARLVLVQDRELVDVGNPGACNEFNSQAPLSSLVFTLDLTYRALRAGQVPRSIQPEIG